MKRLSPTIRLSALAAVLIGLALAHAVPACVYRWPTSTGYAPLVEFHPGVCGGTDLTWLRWLAAIGGLLVAVSILSVAWTRNHVGDDGPARRTMSPRMRLAMLVGIGAVMVALLVPSLPLAGPMWGAHPPSPLNYFIPLRIAILAVGAIIASLIALTGRSRS
jgi:hypothetical protein